MYKKVDYGQERENFCSSRYRIYKNCSPCRKEGRRRKIRIIGLGHSASRGVKRGVVLNVEEAFAAISDAIGQAEKDCGQDIENVYVNISGQQLTTQTNTQQRILGRDHCVSEDDIELMMEQAVRLAWLKI